MLATDGGALRIPGAVICSSDGLIVIASLHGCADVVEGNNFSFNNQGLRGRVDGVDQQFTRILLVLLYHAIGGRLLGILLLVVCGLFIVV